MSVTANSTGGRRSRNGLAVCQACGETFLPTRSDGRYCSSACRQKAYRQRRGGTETVTRHARLDAELRAWLRLEIGRLTRKRIAAERAREAAAFRALEEAERQLGAVA